jgi:LytS/YehU family sensor histidine kinase
LLFAAYCRAREREQHVLRAAREAELARADAQREIVASRLKVLQARVEPSLLFDAMADVRAMYLSSPAGADALLDDLVAYLRAALPQMRGGASTVGREIALAEAYLRIVPAGRNKRLATQSSVAEEVADADFPPMVLLPLVHAAADAGCAHVSIDGLRVHGRVAIAVRATCDAVPPAWTGDALDVVRETLLHYLGSDASLTVARDTAGAAATVTWPASDASGLAVQRVA